jgi:hypothetical protein|tara:strand:- start:321 stop:542 length:222 start_codon:yes stop_codon:yes gene_type:complete
MSLKIPHRLTLTEAQISTVLFCMEGYIQDHPDKMNNPEFEEDVESVFEELEGTIDKYYDKIEKAQENQPKHEW